MPEEREKTVTERKADRLGGAGWFMALVLPPIAMATVVAALWHDAFLRTSAESADYGYGAGALGILWYAVFAFTDWARYRHRTAALLSLPLVLSGIAFGLGIYNLAMDYRGETGDCRILDSETYRVDTRSGSHWETAYDLDCGGYEVQYEEAVDGPAADEPDFGDEFGCCQSDPESIHLEYDPRGLVQARAAGQGDDPWAFLNAALIAFGLGVVLRLIARPTVS